MRNERSKDFPVGGGANYGRYWCMQRKLTLALSVLLLGCFAVLSVAQKPKGGSKEVIKVLILDGQNNHKWRETTPVLKDIYESSDRFTVEVSTSPGEKAEKSEWKKWRPKFSDYDVVVSNYNGQMWPAPVRKDFEKYVANGGGFVPVHAADNAFSLWEEYNKMIGLGGWGGRTEESGPYVYYNKEGELVRDPSPGKGGGHGPRGQFIVHRQSNSHPITKGMAKEWLKTWDELYDQLRGPAENMEILATGLSGTTDRYEPLLMALTYGDGRVFHTTLGHDTKSMLCRGFYDTLQRGTEWAATNNVSIDWSDDFPTKDQVSVVKMGQ